MRIISGKLRGHRLKSFKADHIRPTTDRVKESVFNKLAGEFDQAHVLDLFSGTGNLSFEAYSRGAADVVAVELSKKSIQIIKDNLKHLKIASGITIVHKDVIVFLKEYKDQPFDIIFVDPPFTKKMAHEVMQALSGSSVLAKNTTVVIESTVHERIDTQYGDLAQFFQKDYGDKKVSYFSCDIED